MEDNRRETPFVYNVGDRLKYIHSKGETITVIERHHEYNKETGTTKNIYFLTIENCDGCNYAIQNWASENHMMTYMHRVYSPGTLFNPEDFEKRSNDALSCGYYKALEEENTKLKNEIEALLVERKFLRAENTKLLCDNKKLANGGAKYSQKIACAVKQLDEAAKRIYETSEHLSI